MYLAILSIYIRITSDNNLPCTSLHFHHNSNNNKIKWRTAETLLFLVTLIISIYFYFVHSLHLMLILLILVIYQPSSFCRLHHILCLIYNHEIVLTFCWFFIFFFCCIFIHFKYLSHGFFLNVIKRLFAHKNGLFCRRKSNTCISMFVYLFI